MQAATGAPDNETALTIVNAMPAIERAARWLDDFGASAALPGNLVEILQVVLDEVLTNVIGHGLRDAPAGSREITIGLRRTPGWITLEVSDDGPEFDPTTSVPTPTPTRVATRQVGGVGLLMVRKLMDRSSFARDSGHNRLTLWKRMPL